MGLLVHCFDSTDLYTGGDGAPAEANLWFPCSHADAWCEGLRDRLSASIVNADLPYIYGQAGFILSPEATPIFCSYSADGGTTDKVCGHQPMVEPKRDGPEGDGEGGGGVGGDDGVIADDWMGKDGCADAWCSQYTCGDARCASCASCAPGYSALPERNYRYPWPDRDWAPEGCLPGCGEIGSGAPNWCEIPLTAGDRSRGCAFKAADTASMLRNQHAQNSMNYNEIVVDAEMWARGLPYSIEAVFIRKGARQNWDTIARRVHERFQEEFSALLGPGAVPLLRFDPAQRRGALEAVEVVK